MIDTIRLQHLHGYADADTLQAIADSLPMDMEGHEPRNGKVPYHDGKIQLDNGTLYVYLDSRVLKVNGSLCKAMHGNNFVLMTHNAICSALNTITENCGIPLEQWTVTRLDLATNMLMDKPPQCYLHRFGQLRHYDRMPQHESTTLYYAQTNRQLCIYDKGAEAGKRKTPPEYATANVLRMESRVFHGQRAVMEAYKLDEPLTAAMLCDRAFYLNTIVKRYLELLSSITLNEDMEINIENLTSTREVDQMGRAALLEKAGGINNMIELINRRRAEGAISRKQACDLRKIFKTAAAADNPLLLPSDEVEELKAKIHELPEKLQKME